MNKRQVLTGILTITTIFALGCETAQTTSTANAESTKVTAHQDPFDKPGFKTEIEDGRLWILKDGEEMSEKHISLIGAGPAGMTIRALSKDTASEYMAAKPGFHTELEDGRLWVLKDGEEKAEKRISFIGAGPMGMTIYGQSKDTVVEYLGTKPGFETKMIDGRLWVFKDGQAHSEKHITLIGAGPLNTSIKALDRETAQEYMAAAPGFKTDIVDGRIWVFAPGQTHSEKHITLIGAGPMNMTVKAIDRATASKYLAAVN
tara:strand:+ start:255 stop:1034 length:780 start_codon:yes stop_codon:yes gene_type:complete